MRTRTKIVAGTALTLLALAGLGGTGATVVGRQVGGPGGGTSTSTTSTKRVTTVVRVDLDPAPAPACGFPGTDPELVDETVVELEPTVSSSTALGPTTIYVGEGQQTPFFVAAGTTNVDILTTYETVVTQYFQATEPGPPCAVVLGARFTG